MVNRYYDPTTDEFLSVDPDVATTDQPYVFTNDDPLNAEDPLGLKSPKTSLKVKICIGMACVGTVLGLGGSVSKPSANPDANSGIGEIHRGIPEVGKEEAPSGQTYVPKPGSGIQYGPFLQNGPVNSAIKKGGIWVAIGGGLFVVGKTLFGFSEGVAGSS